MNSLNNIIQFLRKNPNHTKEKSPEGFCPNCWGRQEYGGNFYNALKTESPKDMELKKGWITTYVEQNLKRIQIPVKTVKPLCNVCFESFPR